MMDSSEHIDAEKELKKEKKFLQNILATIPDSLLVLNKHLRIKSANRSFYELFQAEPEKIMGSKIADVLGDKDGKLSAKLAQLFGTEDMMRGTGVLKLGEFAGGVREPTGESMNYSVECR